MHPLPGTYALIFSSSRKRQLTIGKLGAFQLKPGFYIYVGSAFGPGGLQARIAHHCKKPARPHWHIDYLASFLKLTEIRISILQTISYELSANVYVSIINES